jgi:hypothetical protein
MIHNFINKIHLPALSVLVAFAFTACEGWTDIEGVEINQQSPSGNNPKLYAQYLESLRAYKQTEHYVTYAWFDNSVKVPYSRGQHLSDLPDSLDVVSLIYPDRLAFFELQEMEDIRTNKGTKVVYGISYETIRKTYEQTVKEKTAEDANYKAPEFTTYLTETVQKELLPAATYNYDGIIVGYKGAGIVYMNEAEKTEYLKNQEAFFSAITAWKTANTNMMLVFEGNPQNLSDKSILSSCEHIILNTLDATSTGTLSLAALQALADGVPSTKFIVAARTVSLDTTDKTTGYHDNGERAIIESAYWVAKRENAYAKAGLGIYHIQNDYYNSNLIYQYARKAINIMNPAPIK